MPSHLAISHMVTLVKQEQFHDMMIAIKLLDKVLDVQKAEHVGPHLKEIMLGLLKVNKCFPVKCKMQNYLYSRLMTMLSQVCVKQL
jgi:hypothetical protein